MKRYLITFLLISVPLMACAFDESLEAPDVDFSLQVLHSRADLAPLGTGTSTGISLRLGADLKDASKGSWLWSLEGGLNYWGSADHVSFQELCGPSSPQGPCMGNPDIPSNPSNINRAERYDSLKHRLSGLELGARLFDSQLFYTRAGIFLYNLKQREQRTQYYYDSSSNLIPPVDSRSPAEESLSGIGPYLGAGLSIPVIQDLKLLLEANVYRVEKENIGLLNAGLRLDF